MLYRIEVFVLFCGEDNTKMEIPSYMYWTIHQEKYQTFSPKFENPSKTILILIKLMYASTFRAYCSGLGGCIIKIEILKQPGDQDLKSNPLTMDPPNFLFQ